MSKVRYPIRDGQFHLELTGETLVSKQSEYQRIEVVGTEVFGRILLLDGHVQLSLHDEAAYHESLVHIPAMSVEKCRRVLIVGGGDGGAAREALKLSENVKVDMVEIDDQVIEIAKEYMPQVSDGAFDDPRLNVVVGDATEFVQQAKRVYNLVVMDLTDFSEDVMDIDMEIFGEKFLADIKQLLQPGGVVVTQSDNAIYCPESASRVSRHLSKNFRYHGSYYSIVPSFGSFSAFAWGSNNIVVGPPPQHPIPSGMRYLNSATYALAFNLPYASPHQIG